MVGPRFLALGLALAMVSGMTRESSARTASFVYVGNADGNEISVLQLDPQTGDLTGVETAPIPGIAQPGISTPIAVSPDRRFLVDPGTGTLSPIGSVSTEKQPRGFNIDPSGRYLLAVGQLSHALSSYRIDACSGQLLKLKEYPMGKNPNWVEIVELPSAV